MPQEFHVVKCFICEIYQVDIVKQTKKWICKVCNQKQSLIQEFERGTSRKCRELAQNLNKKSVEKTLCKNSYEHDCVIATPKKKMFDSKKSKWTQFSEESESKTAELVKNCANSIFYLDPKKEKNKKPILPYLDNLASEELKGVESNLFNGVGSTNPILQPTRVLDRQNHILKVDEKKEIFEKCENIEQRNAVEPFFYVEEIYKSEKRLREEYKSIESIEMKE